MRALSVRGGRKPLWKASCKVRYVTARVIFA